MMSRSEDRAGSSVAEINLAVTEVIAGDPTAALACLDRGLMRFPIPGGHRSLGWLHLLRAHVLARLEDAPGALAAIAAADAVFGRIGERSGAAAAQRMRKVGPPILRTRASSPREAS